MKKIPRAFLLFVATLFLLFITSSKTIYAQIGQQWETIVGELNTVILDEGEDNPGSGGGRNFPKCNNLESNPTKCLMDDFKTVVVGYNSYSPSNSDKTRVYNIMWANSQSERWRSLLLNGGQITIRIGNTPSGSYADKNSATLPKFVSLPSLSQRYLLTHELGHTIGNRNIQLYNKYDANALAKKDPTCYESSTSATKSGNFLKSYVLRYFCQGTSYSILHNNESFAEASADYLTKTSVNRTGFLCGKTISNFKTQCRDTYDWTKNNIYGGYEFY